MYEITLFYEKVSNKIYKEEKRLEKIIINVSCFLVYIHIYSGNGQQQSKFTNTPPISYLDRDWQIWEDEKVNSVIARVQGIDNEQDILTFGLESKFNNGEDNLPFRIDQNTGIVYLNESLEGRGGERLSLYVTVSDGALTGKTEVLVNIRKRGETANSRPGTFNPHKTNLSQILPPFHSLPGVLARPNLPPINVPPLSRPLPPLPPELDIHQHHKGSGQTHTYPDPPSIANDAKDVADHDGDGDGDDDGGGEHTDISTHPSTTTKTVKSGGVPNDKRNGTNTTNTTTFLRPSLNTMLPISIIICGILIAAGLVVSFLFRKRLCAIGKSLKKKSKEEMAKKSNQSNLSNSNITVTTVSESSRNSIVMQHWNGPTAFSNRYVPWERENHHMQVLIHFFLYAH